MRVETQESDGRKVLVVGSHDELTDLKERIGAGEFRDIALVVVECDPGKHLTSSDMRFGEDIFPPDGTAFDELMREDRYDKARTYILRSDRDYTLIDKPLMVPEKIIRHHPVSYRDSQRRQRRK